MAIAVFQSIVDVIIFIKLKLRYTFVGLNCSPHIIGIR